MDTPKEPPSHVLIIGSGVFGLSTAHALSKRPTFSKTRITVISPEPSSNARPLPASIDSNRIIRADYADPHYSALAAEAQKLWRTEEWGGRGRYHECGLLLTGEAYVTAALTNVQSHMKVRVLESAEAITDAMRAGPDVARGTGDHGYINFESGWADAGGAMEDLTARVRSSGRVEFISGKVEALVTDDEDKRVCGALLADGRTVEADVTICAAGAWTAALVDISGVATCTAQPVAYFDLTAEEAEKLSSIPVHLDLGTGCFLFPPNRKPDGGYEIKAARHFLGYSNPTSCPPALGTDRIASSNSYRPSLPSDAARVPQSDVDLLSNFLSQALPILGEGRLPRQTRLCHYSDTQDGEFIVSPHPFFAETLFVMCGDSGHAFKMLPVIGEHVVDVLFGGEVKSHWSEAWRWPSKAPSTGQVRCEDGSRAGREQLNLAECS